jgi:hypothetical protein
VTTIAFLPSNASIPPFQAQVTLDSSPYTLASVWNVYRGDWYLSLTDQGGNLVGYQPLVGSPPGAAIYLFPGRFTTSTILYRASTGNFEIGP